MKVPQPGTAKLGGCSSGLGIDFLTGVVLSASNLQKWLLSLLRKFMLYGRSTIIVCDELNTMLHSCSWGHEKGSALSDPNHAFQLLWHGSSCSRCHHVTRFKSVIPLNEVTYLGIKINTSLTSIAKTNYTVILKKIAEDVGRWQHLPASVPNRISVIKMNILPRINFMQDTGKNLTLYWGDMCGMINDLI